MGKEIWSMLYKLYKFWKICCKLPAKLHRVTGPLAHHVVLNHTFEHGAIFLATCNAILLLVDVKLANTRLNRVTGPFAYDVVLNHTFKLLINTTMLF